MADYAEPWLVSLFHKLAQQSMLLMLINSMIAGNSMLPLLLFVYQLPRVAMATHAGHTIRCIKSSTFKMLSLWFIVTSNAAIITAKLDLCPSRLQGKSQHMIYIHKCPNNGGSETT